MSTTISVATPNCIVLGCDSLATTSRKFVSLYALHKLFFNAEGKRDLSIELTKDLLLEIAEDVAYDQNQTETKLFSLEPLFAGLLFAGLTHIGSKSFKNVVDDFKATPQFENLKNGYTIDQLTECLRNFVFNLYTEAKCTGVIEIIISGYRSGENIPEICKITILPGDVTIEAANKHGEFGAVLGGDSHVIQRVIRGIDPPGFREVMDAIELSLTKYRRHLASHLAGRGITENLPEYNYFVKNLSELYGAIPFKGTFPPIEQFSEQATIEFVEFLIDLTIKSQQFSNLLPTVGGDIHIGMITYSNGFKWISKEEYKFRGTSVPK
jgi:hypothetical protein